MKAGVWISIVGDATGRGGCHWWRYFNSREISKGYADSYEDAVKAADEPKEETRDR